MSFRFAVLTVSDRSARGERPDASGPALVEMVKRQGWDVIRQSVLPDDLNMLRELLESWSDRDDVDVILTTGGTGFSPLMLHRRRHAQSLSATHPGSRKRCGRRAPPNRLMPCSHVQ